MFRGRLDSATRTRIAGWAQDERLPHQPVALLVIDNDTLLDRVVANRHRPDLAAGGIGDGRHGFDIRLNGGLAGLGQHLIRVVRERDGAELAGSPILIGAADTFDDEALASLQSMLDGIAGPAAIDAAMLNLSAQIERLAGRTLQAEPAGQKPQVLIIDTTMPQPDRDAGSNAVLSHAESLIRLGYAVSFAAADASRATFDHEAIDWLQPPRTRSVEEILARQADRFDIVYLHRLDAAACYMPLVRFHQKRARIIYSVADLHHVRLARRGFIEREADLIARARQVRATELAVAGAADVVLTHSPVEAAILRASMTEPRERVIVTPWAVPLTRPPKRPPATKTIGFIGHFGHAPNLDAARRLAFDIMPLLRAHDPAITCLIAGSAMPAAMRNWDAPGVTLLGHVADLPGFFARLILTVAPMSYGAGIKGKLLDSLAAGVPCVATPIAVEGLDWPNALAPCLAATDETLAARIIALLADNLNQRHTASAGQALIARDWSAKAVDAALAQACRLPFAVTGEQVRPGALPLDPAGALGPRPR